MGFNAIVERAGGRKQLARAAGVPLGTVHNWGRPKASGGCGGQIPERYRERLIKALQITYADFAPDQGDATTDQRLEQGGAESGGTAGHRQELAA